ncbi:MAG: TOBE domain-containing protein, partial [Nitrososphaerota archaeon]
YDSPANLFVAGFIGSPSMNLFDAKLVRRDGVVALALASEDARATTWPVQGHVAERLAEQATSEGRPVVVGIRPEGLRLASEAASNTIAGVVDVVEHLGNEQFVYLRLPGAIFTDTAETQGSVARLPSDARVHVGQALTVAADADALHVFDPATTHRLA